jgi:hypothetical protein
VKNFPLEGIMESFSLKNGNVLSSLGVPESLHQWQNWMSWMMTDPQGVVDALEESFGQWSEIPGSQRLREPTPRALGLLVEPPKGAIEERLSVYAEGYYSRIYEALSSDFPHTFRCLGEDAFRDLVAVYLVQHPSVWISLADVGHHLPSFVKGHELQSTHPYLHELVSLERLFHEVFYDPVSPTCLLASWGPNSGTSELFFDTNPTLKIVSLCYDLYRFYDESSDVFCPVQLPSLQWVALFKGRDGFAHLLCLKPWEKLLLELMMVKKPLSICFELLQEQWHEHLEPMEVQTCFSLWAAHQVLIGSDSMSDQGN